MYSQINIQRITKNTFLLYIRTVFIMFTSLYTSRVVLTKLGVENYGIYQVVGGMVAMFSVVSAALSSSISRFITIELGRNNPFRLRTIFATSVNIQIIFSFIALLLGEIIGVWFLNHKMNIPLTRVIAAKWVLQCSLFTFCVNLISVPYNACIIAHERMSAFAYISILEVSLKLAICYILNSIKIDILIIYSILMLLVAIVVRFTYSIYCRHNFNESNYHWVIDKNIFKEMASFASWNFVTNTAYLLNTQGVNLLINIFFGVTLNAARGIATQVEGAVLQFVNNFTTALNPQITKCYASGEHAEMFELVCRGAKLSFFLLFFMALPIFLETKVILTLWLRKVPDFTVVFVRLTLCSALVDILGKTGYTACMATGDIKRYVIWITLVGLLVFPLTWAAFSLGCQPKSTYIIYILVYTGVDITRLFIMRGLLNFPISQFIKRVIYPVLFTTIIGIILPILVVIKIPSSITRFFITCLVGCISSGLSIWFIGLSRKERDFVQKQILKLFSKSTLA